MHGRPAPDLLPLSATSAFYDARQEKEVADVLLQGFAGELIWEGSHRSGPHLVGILLNLQPERNLLVSSVYNEERLRVSSLSRHLNTCLILLDQSRNNHPKQPTKPPPFSADRLRCRRLKLHGLHPAKSETEKIVSS